MARKGGSSKKPTLKPIPLPVEDGAGRGHYTQWTVPPIPKNKSKSSEKEKAHEQE